MPDELFPDRRQQPRLPRVLRAARVDRHLDGDADQRDLRVRVDAGEDPDRLRAEGDRRRLGRRLLGPEGDLQEYKAQRSTRPSLLKEQWPHLEPLVDAFGYRNLAVDGYEADDVIASIVEKARREQPPIPVMVVTGDRDAYQLVDNGVRIMTTSRGITDTRVYDREGRGRALRDPARADPGLHRAQR